MDQPESQPLPDEPLQVFPRLKERDPFKVLGISREASFEEVQDARNFLYEQYKGHEPSREAIELAFDSILQSSIKFRNKYGFKPPKTGRRSDVSGDPEKVSIVQRVKELFEPSVSSVTLNRLIEERKAWRKNRPFGFTAKPEAGADGEVDLTKWSCIVPGKEGTIWEGAALPVTITFTNQYPAKPPRVAVPKGFYHPNIYPSGTVCLSILNEDEQWRPSITLRQILLGVQDLLNNPNEKSPAQSEAFMDYTNRRKKYEARVKEEVKKYPSKV